MITVHQRGGRSTANVATVRESVAADPEWSIRQRSQILDAMISSVMLNILQKKFLDHVFVT